MTRWSGSLLRASSKAEWSRRRRSGPALRWRVGAVSCLERGDLLFPLAKVVRGGGLGCRRFLPAQFTVQEEDHRQLSESDQHKGNSLPYPYSYSGPF